MLFTVSGCKVMADCVFAQSVTSYSHLYVPIFYFNSTQCGKSPNESSVFYSKQKQFYQSYACILYAVGYILLFCLGTFKGVPVEN